MFKEKSIPRGLCQCGCGRATSLALYTDKRSQSIKRQPRRFIDGHDMRSHLLRTMNQYTHAEPMSGCWLWIGPVSGRYGQVTQKNRHLKAHNVSYTLLIGPIPKGLELDHLCRTPECINPDHLEPVTHSENVRRGLSSIQLLAKFRAQTHCKHGHEFNEENTWFHIKNGWRLRHCRVCTKLRMRERRKAARPTAE